MLSSDIPDKNKKKYWQYTQTEIESLNVKLLR